MNYKNLFEKFNEGGKLLLKDATVTFDAIPWSKHPTFEGVELPYEAGVISIFPIGVPHEVIAGDDGLYLFAKFMPALC